MQGEGEQFTTSPLVTRVGTTPSELISQAPFTASEEKQALLRHDSCALFMCLLQEEINHASYSMQCNDSTGKLNAASALPPTGFLGIKLFSPSEQGAPSQQPVGTLLVLPLTHAREWFQKDMRCS